MRLAISACGLAAMLLASCGYVGDPHAPSPMTPRPVADLRAAEVGSNFVVEFTIPALTTDNFDLASVQSVDLYAGPNSNPFNQAAWLAGAKKMKVAATAAGAVTHEFPVAPEWIGKEVVIAVRATGPKGKTSGWSNFAVIPAITGLPRPAAVKAEALPQGVGLSWQGAAPHYRIYRIVGDPKPGDTMPEAIGTTDQVSFRDEKTEFGTKYRYLIMGLVDDVHQSVVSEEASITPADTFPPAVPAGLSAVQGLKTIELTWDRNTEADLRGYNVYRSTGGAFEKVAGPVDTPTYSDGNVTSAMRYRYTVSAIDVTGNESARSTPVEAEAP